MKNKLPFNMDEYENAHHKENIKCVCSLCSTEFTRIKKLIRIHWHENKSNRLYCSPECVAKSQIKKIATNCSNCNNLLYRIPSVIKKSKSKRFFCDTSCAATYNNKHKTHGTRRSKMETFLESVIRNNFPELNLLCNDKTAIGSELDFYFPDLLFAIELNGIFHYEPIYGQKKLNQIQSNDNRKIIACYEQGIELAIIDSSSCKNVTDKQKVKYSAITNDLLKTVIKNRNS